jgi:sucrose phosphorylase
MQSQRDETLKTLLSDLYRDDSSVDLEKLSSQLLQILSESSADDDVPISSSRWREDDVVLITYANTVADDAVFGLQSLRQFGEPPLGAIRSGDSCFAIFKIHE